MKYKEIKKMGREDLNRKMEELKMELIKSKAKSSKAGNSKQIRKIIARISTFNAFKSGGVENK